MTTVSLPNPQPVEGSSSSSAFSQGHQQQHHHHQQQQQQQQQSEQQHLEESNSSSNNSSPIRHSGRALVRGKIRRVWRPRYMEVWANGLVRYYEVPPPTHSTYDVFVDSANSTAPDYQDLELDVDNEDQYHSKSPKCTLWIHYARIIDVTTLRDMHVGLPRGTFGFLFHGHRMDQDDLMDPFLFASDYTSSNNAALTMMGATSSMAACQGNTNMSQPRDFLCAVTTLEEAQSWVIALQWAASMGRDNAYSTTTAAASSSSGAGLLFPWTNNNSNNNNNNNMLSPSVAPPLSPPRNHAHSNQNITDESSCSWEHTDGLSTASSYSSLHQAQQPQQQHQSTTPVSPLGSSPAKTPSKSPTQTQSTQSTTPTNTTQQQPTPPKPTVSGKMVVTKVVGYTLARVDTWKWDVAYQIQVLLVMPAQEQVQEWSILRTARDVQQLVDQLSLTSAKLYKQSQWIAGLPQLQQSLRHTSMNTKNMSKAIATVENTLRSLCMEATLVNSTPMKRFLGLYILQQQASTSSYTNNHKQPSCRPPSLWNRHDPMSIASTPKRTRLKDTTTKTTTTDEYAKCWVHQQQQKLQQNLKAQSTTKYGITFQCLIWYLRLPQPATTYGGIGLLSSWCLPGMNRLISKYNLLPQISLRLDVLILSWVVAAGVGRFLAPTTAVESSPSHQSTARRRLQATSRPRQGKRQPQDEEGQSTTSSAIISPGKQQTEEVVMEGGEDDYDEEDEEGEEAALEATTGSYDYDQQQQEEDSHLLSSPLPQYNPKEGTTSSCWSTPKDDIFHVRGPNYLADRVKMPSEPASFTCQGVDMWMTDNPERHIARHPSVLGGKLKSSQLLDQQDMFLVNFLLPFGNFVAYFSVPPLKDFRTPQLADVWTRFINGDQQYRDARLKMLPVVVDGPWIVRAAVGPGTAPALLGKAIPLQYFFTQKHSVDKKEKDNNKDGGKNIYEVDVIITASSIAKGILSVVKGHTKALSIAFAFIIEAAEQKELPETVLCSFQVHSLNLDECPHLPDCNLDP